MIDFRSDTVTKPTETMRKAMYEAVVGDDVYRDDPTVNALEKEAAAMLGKEAALFVPSGHMGNQVAIMTHTGRGDEIILGDHCHIKTYEVGAAAVLSGVSFHTVKEHEGMMDVRKVDHAVRGEDIHFPRSSLICIENAHGSGRVAPLSYMESIRNIADQHGLMVHLDGARLFNAAVAHDVDVTTYTSTVDSVMFCLSKGLGAPVGSILAGSEAFVARARRNRKLFGGGMRQAGIIAAPGLAALDNVDRLADDHENARVLAERLADVDGLDLQEPETNIVLVDTERAGLTAETFLDDCEDAGVLGTQFDTYVARFCTHWDVDREDVETAAERVSAALDA